MDNQTSPSPESSDAGRWVWAIMLLAIGLVYAAIVLNRPQRKIGETHPTVGKTLLDLQLAPLIGTDQGVGLADLKGKVSLLNLWGTWCGPCRREFPHLVTMYGQLRGNPRFRMLSVSCPPGGDLAAMETLQEDSQAFVDHFQAEFPIYADSDLTTQMAVQMALGSLGFPTSIVFDDQGIIRGVWTGYAPGDIEQIQALINHLLTEEEATQKEATHKKNLPNKARGTKPTMRPFPLSR